MSFSSLAGTLPSPFELRPGRREKVLAFENAQIDAQDMGHRFHHVHPISKEVKVSFSNNRLKRRKRTKEISLISNLTKDEKEETNKCLLDLNELERARAAIRHPPSCPWASALVRALC